MDSKYEIGRVFPSLKDHLRFSLFRQSTRRSYQSADVRGFFSARGLGSTIGSYGVGLAIVSMVTLFYRSAMPVNATTVGFTFLLVILCASALWGLGVSCMMSVAATLAFDYFFLPPIGSLDIADPQDWVALSSFLITAVLGSSLSARAHSRAMESNRRREEVEMLYALSQRLLDERNLVELAAAIPQHIVESFSAEAAALFLFGEGNIYHAGPKLSQLGEARLRQAATSEDEQANGQNHVWFAPLKCGAELIGSVGISGLQVSNGTMGALGGLVAAAIERAGAVDHAAKMEVARQSEEFKSVMLDAITHDFRTPLTGIKTSVTALLTDLEFDKAQTKEFLSIIDEECDRIDQLIDKASELARLESGEVKLAVRPHTIGELISAALTDCKRVSRAREIQHEMKHDGLLVSADLVWARSVLVHLIVNAHLYSWPGQPITISTETKGDFVLFSVADQGPGIHKEEAGRVFEKYYRCKDQKVRAHGTGMGLPIARAIVEAHGGTIGVVSRFGQGSVFTFSLPLYFDRAAEVNVARQE